MCDYSLEAYRSRPAEEGEKLTLERFPSGSMGFTTGPACDLAVCVPAESHLLLQGIGDTVRESCGVGAVEEGVMTRLEGGPYKDAVRFSYGVEIMLQRLDVGLVAADVREHVAAVVPPSLMDEVAKMLAGAFPPVDVGALRESAQWPRVREAVQVAFRLVHAAGEGEGSGQDSDGRN